jgi:hypothetical protein
MPLERLEQSFPSDPRHGSRLYYRSSVNLVASSPPAKPGRPAADPNAAARSAPQEKRGAAATARTFDFCHLPFALFLAAAQSV